MKFTQVAATLLLAFNNYVYFTTNVEEIRCNYWPSRYACEKDITGAAKPLGIFLCNFWFIQNIKE